MFREIGLLAVAPGLVAFAMCLALRGQANASVSDLVKQYQEDNVESLALTMAPEAKREGTRTIHSKLTLPVKERTLTFEDVVGGTASVSTRLVGSFEIPGVRRDYLLLEGFSNDRGWGKAWILVNGKSGKMARLRGEPILSPGGKFYASAYLKELQPSTIAGISIIKAEDYSEQFRADVSDADGWTGESLQVIWADSKSFMVLEPVRLYDQTQFLETAFVPGTFCELARAKWKCSHHPSDLRKRGIGD